MKLKLLINKYINRYSQIIKIYNIWWLVITIYWKIRIFIKQQTFNLENPLEKQLAKINSFYEVLNKVEEPNKDGIMFSITKNNNIIELLWNNMEEDYYYIDNIKDDDYNIFKDKVVFWYHLSDYLNPNLKKDEIDKEWEISYEEFYLLMQIYFWLYQEEELKNKLEEKDKNWEYEEIKKELKWKYWKERLNSNYFEFEKEYLSKPEVQEYLKLELMRKDISWAFEWLEIEKIYDKDWSEEKQRKYIDKINKEFGKEVVVEELENSN
jgi:hypothetical protein